MCFWKKKKVTIKWLTENCTSPERLSAWLRRNIYYKTDVETHGVRDYWQHPEWTLRNREGDCEDFAWLAYEVLKKQGYSPELISVTHSNGNTHAVCAFFANLSWYHMSNWRMKKCDNALCLKDVAQYVYRNWIVCEVYSPVQIKLGKAKPILRYYKGVNL